MCVCVCVCVWVGVWVCVGMRAPFNCIFFMMVMHLCVGGGARGQGRGGGVNSIFIVLTGFNKYAFFFCLLTNLMFAVIPGHHG